MGKDNRGWSFSVTKALLWIMDSYFGQKDWVKLKKGLTMYLFLTNMQLYISQNIIDRLVSCGLL